MAILAVQNQSAGAKQVTPNLLPCEIHHDGPLALSTQYWQPTIIEGEKTAHFRGRRLLGKAVQLPNSHEGVLLKITDDKLVSQASCLPDESGDQEEENEEPEEVHVAEHVASFSELVVWNHDAVPEASEDQHIKGIEEWIGMAEAIHGS